MTGHRLVLGFPALVSVVPLVKGRRGTVVRGVMEAARLVGESIETTLECH